MSGSDLGFVCPGASLAQFSGMLAASSLLLVSGQDHGRWVSRSLGCPHRRADVLPGRPAAQGDSPAAATGGVSAGLMIAVSGMRYATTSVGGLY